MRLLLIASLFCSFAASATSVDPDDSEAFVQQALTTEEIVVQGRRNLSRNIKKGFAAFRAREFEQAEKYFFRVRSKYELQALITYEAYADMWSPANLTGAIGITTNNKDWEVRKALSIIHYMEGMSQRAQGNTLAARGSFKRALNMNPTHFDARADLALVEIENGEAERSTKHIKRLAKDLQRCDAAKSADKCGAVKDRLWQVELAYGNALSSN